MLRKMKIDEEGKRERKVCYEIVTSRLLTVNGVIHARSLGLMGHPRPFFWSVDLIRLFQRSVLNFQRSESLVLLTLQSPPDAITIQFFSVLWPHLHDITNHVLICHIFFHYSSPNTLNYEVLNGCINEKINQLW